MTMEPVRFVQTIAQTARLVMNAFYVMSASSGMVQNLVALLVKVTAVHVTQTASV
jgi:hypothetical protein